MSRNHDEARALIRSLGYGPDGGLKVKVSARNIVWNHDPAAIPMDLLKEIWIDGELGRLNTNWVPKLRHKDFTVAMSLRGFAVVASI